MRKGTSKYIGKFKMGDSFGKWMIINETPTNDKNCKIKAKCECGTVQYVYAARLINGKSTGCRRCKTAGINHHKWSGVGELPGTIMYTIKQNAKRKNREISVTLEYLWELFQKQNGKCALTGVTIHFLKSNTKEQRDTTASLDRINSDIGYIEGNVQWVHKNINGMKSDFSQREFIKWCTAVSDYAKYRKLDLE